jgi:hypothetical protein
LQIVAILRAEHQRPRELLPLRLCRHYYDYDIAILADSAIGTAALADMALLNQVAAHQEWAYPRSWGRLQHGTLCLVPTIEQHVALRQDYLKLAPTILGQPPAFEHILERWQRSKI